MVESTSVSSNNRNVYSVEMAEDFTVDKAREMKAPTEKLLCKLSDNDKIAFGEFTIRDFDSKTVL